MTTHPAPPTELPELVRRYLERSLPRDGAVPRAVRIAQTGSMWQKPGARELRFTAAEDFAVEHVGFTWRARFPVLGPISIRVVDGYENGVGWLEARVLGVPIQRQGGRETLVGEALRYVAELPWAPYAMGWNRELEWREAGERSIEVAARIGAERAAVTLEFSADGDVLRASSPARPRVVGKTAVPTPWAGDYSGYDVVGGVRIPTVAEVRWELPEGPFVYWRGRVTSLELVR